MAKGKKPVRPPSPDPVIETLLDLRDRVAAHAKTDVMFAHGRPFVLMEYAFRLLARRRRQLGLNAIRELAPWLAKLVRSRAIESGPGILLAECFWDFTADEARAWVAMQPPLAHLVPPPIEQVLVTAKWHGKQRAFNRLRERDPARARALLERPPEGLAAADRRNLLGLLREGLSEDDRAFLEREGSPLLVFLPGSSLWNELGRLADKLMTLADGRLRITPPERFEDVFAQLGLEEKKATASSWATFTTEQYWLYQLLRVLPLAHLQARWRLAPGAIVDLFLDDAAHARYRWALHGNIYRLRSPDWIRALLDRRAKFSAEGLAASSCRSLARQLPPAEREQVLERFIQTDDATNDAVDDFPDAFDHVWSPSFTRRMIARTAFTPLVHHGNGQISDELAQLLPGDTPEAKTFRDELAAAWRERDEILSRF